MLNSSAQCAKLVETQEACPHTLTHVRHKARSAPPSRDGLSPHSGATVGPRYYSWSSVVVGNQAS